jgi:hypothetical protein
MSTLVSERDRDVYRGIVDQLLPATGALPAASAAGVCGEMLDKILGWRPDLTKDLLRGLAAVRELTPADAIAWLEAHDAAAYHAIRLAALGAYYLDPAVRQAIGYPGQQSRPAPADERPDYLASGLLDPVKRRGPIWREAKTEPNQEKKTVAKHVFLAFTNPVAGREDEFNDWQDNVHLPHGLKNPGFVKATRYKLADAQFAPGEGRTKYLTIWEIESDDITATLTEAGERNKTAVYTDALDFNTIGTVVYTAVRKT